MFVYPSILPSTAQAFNLASRESYNPQNDILISIEYAVSGNVNTEAGLSFFLLSNAPTFNGGISGSDLSYSGYVNGTQKGISTGIVCLGIDSTGCFGLSAGELGAGPLSAATLSAFYRDGYTINDRVPNSVAVRGSRADYYAMSSFNSYYKSTSSFNLIENTFESRYLRFRVGNVARTLYLDYKQHFDECYRNIATVDIGPYIDISVFHRIGIGFSTPVSSSNANSVANFFFKKIHIEGLTSTLSSIQPLIEVWENISVLWPDVGETWSL